MDKFEASNGIRITPTNAGQTAYATTMEDDTTSLVHLGFAEFAAFREYFRAEEDKRLGRWRYADHLVVHADGSGGARVLDERMPHLSNEFRREHFHSGEGPNSTELREAARAYFEAHPVVQPWHDAKEGEVWELTFRTGAHAWFVNGNYFQSTKTLTNIHKTDAGITAARRIYPE